MAEQGWWERWPWRLVQTNLREIDMADIDADRYATSLRDLGATVAMINTSGIIASYATALPFHTPSAHLHGDDLPTIIAACHDVGIKVIARTDFSKVRPELHERHPSWASRTRDGEVVVDGGDVHVCPSGAYQQELAPRIVEETITVLDVDGIYCNMAGFQRWDYHGVDHGICHCEACVEGFRATSGGPLPCRHDLDDETSRRYLGFQAATVADATRRLHAVVRRLRPDVAIDRPTDELGGFVRSEANTALDREPAEWTYTASSSTKWALGSFPRTVASTSSVDFIDYPVRHVSVSPERQRLRLARSLANGGGLDHYLIGRLDRRYDRSGLDGVRELFAFHAAHEHRYRHLRSAARVALLTGEHGRGAEYRGWFRALAQLHVPFDVMSADRVAEPALRPYDAVILPDHEPLPDAVATALDRFVADGRTLIATGRTGWRTGSLEPRPAPALACLGIEQVVEVRSDLRGAVFSIDVPDRFPSLADTTLVFVDGPYVDAAYARDALLHLQLIPPGPFGPPERCVVPDPTGEPGLVVRPYGAGRAVYVPWSCGALVDRFGFPNTSAFIADVLRVHAGIEPLRGNLSPLVEVTWLRDAERGVDLLHLVNGSGGEGVTCVAPVPMLDLVLAIPVERAPRRVEALVAGGELRWGVVDGWLEVEVPELGLFEAIEVGGSQPPARYGNVVTA